MPKIKKTETENKKVIFTDSTIHGVNYIFNKRISIFERLLWTLAVVSATIGAVCLVHSNFEHFSAHPTVVSIKKDFRNWENDFPAATACFMDKMDKLKANLLLQKTWNISETDEKFEFYMTFIELLTNVSYNKLKDFENYLNDSFLSKLDMAHLVTQVHPEVDGAPVTFQSKSKPSWQFVLTERGLCFTVNSKVSKLFSPSYKDNDTNIMESNLLACHYLNGLCYARYDSNPENPISYYVHSNVDMIHSTSEAPWILHAGEELEVNFEMIETSSSPDIRYLSPAQRKCRFDNEPLRSDGRIYSTSMCYILCRHDLAMKYCGCKPFFYKFLDGPTCDIKGLVCLSKYSHMLTKPPEELGCQCPQPCNLIVYLKQPSKLLNWFYKEGLGTFWKLLEECLPGCIPGLGKGFIKMVMTNI